MVLNPGAELVSEELEEQPMLDKDGIERSDMLDEVGKYGGFGGRRGGLSAGMVISCGRVAAASSTTSSLTCVLVQYERPMMELVRLASVIDGKNSVLVAGALAGTLSPVMFAMLFAFESVGLLERGSRLLRSSRLGEFFDILGREGFGELLSLSEASGVDDGGSWLEERSRADAKGSWGREGWLGR